MTFHKLNYIHLFTYEYASVSFVVVHLLTFTIFLDENVFTGYDIVRTSRLSYKYLVKLWLNSICLAKNIQY